MGSRLKSVGYRVARQASRWLPRHAAMSAAVRLADLRWRWSRTDRNAVSRNLCAVLGVPSLNGQRMDREVFRNFGRYLVEFFTMDRLDHAAVDIEGWRHVQEALTAARGAIILTAHLGNWEMGAAVIRRNGGPIVAIVLPHGDQGMDRMFNAQRLRCGVPVIPLGPQAVRAALAHLRQGGLIGLVGDQAFGGRTVDVRLFGQRVALPVGPAVLSLRSRSPVIPAFLVRTGEGRFQLQLGEPIHPPAGGGSGASARAIIAAFAAVLERHVKRYPGQWMAFRSVFA